MGDFNINVRPDSQGVRFTVSTSDVEVGGVLNRASTEVLVAALCKSAGLPAPWKQG